MNYKNLKIVKQPKVEISPKLRWLNFAGKTDKSAPDYISMITGIEELQSTVYERQLETMVRKQLAAEFPGVEKMKSYENLVDAVMLNIKQKQIELM